MRTSSTGSRSLPTTGPASSTRRATSSVSWSTCCTAEDTEALRDRGTVRSIYDPTVGTGGMLTVADEHLHGLNPQMPPRRCSGRRSIRAPTPSARPTCSLRVRTHRTSAWATPSSSTCSRIGASTTCCPTRPSGRTGRPCESEVRSEHDRGGQGGSRRVCRESATPPCCSFCTSRRRCATSTRPAAAARPASSSTALRCSTAARARVPPRSAATCSRTTWSRPSSRCRTTCSTTPDRHLLVGPVELRNPVTARAPSAHRRHRAGLEAAQADRFQAGRDRREGPWGGRSRARGVEATPRSRCR